jgi:hypothetical protein
MAYTHTIEKNSEDSHQTSPAYVLTFTRWSVRDSKNYTTLDAMTVRNPLVVVNDAVTINVTSNKNSPQHNFSCTLKQGDLNYMTAIHPGDFVIVNMVNSETKAMEIRDRAIRKQPINKRDDGFKGLFKIADVRMQLATAPNGMKQYVVSVTGRAFDEFSNVLYFNPAYSNRENNSFIDNNFKNWRDLILKKDQNNVQNLIKEAVKRTIGVGAKVLSKDAPLNQIPVYKVPGIVCDLLNKKQEKDPHMSKINNYYLGLWSFTGSTPNSKAPFEKGFTNFFQSDGKEKDNWYKTNSPLSGTRQITLQDFSNVSVWSLIQDYSNPVINETYTCFRVAEDGYVYPSFIARQKPFNTPKYKKNQYAMKHTQFLDMPRWKIDPDLIYQISLGRSDAARINFVQIFTRNLAINDSLNQATQIEIGNFVEDKKDIERHGRKPFIKNCNYDYPLDGTDKPEYLGKKYANLVADWVMNGHLKMNGSISCAGIEKPICIGDNLEFDRIVYHIESVQHQMTIAPNGAKKFVTNMSLSMGISEKSSETVPVYGEMDHTDSFTKRKEDYGRERVLPGFSDTQDIPGREDGEEIKETRQATFTNPGSSDKGKK